MKKNRIIIIIVAILSLGLLSGCFSMIEDIEVLEDGSGTMRFALGVESDNYEAFQEAIPEGFELENLFAVIARDENVTSIQFDRYTQDGFNWESVELEVADFTALFGQRRRIGPIEIIFTESEGDFRFTQTVDVASSTLAIPGINLMDLSSTAFTVNLNTPQIIATNGIQPAAGISTWSIPLDEVLQGGSTAFLRADYVLEPYEGFFIPWEVFFPYVVIGFLVLGGLSVLVVVIVNTLGRREKEPTLRFK
jgi:hypothetical protein